VTLRTPPRELVQKYRPQYLWMLPRLRFLAERFPEAVPSSWYRNTAENFTAGGAPRSQHLLGFAVDWARLPGDRRREFVGLAAAVGFVAVDEGDHIHTQVFRANTLPASLFPRNFSV
jgi:hypothetical protein